MLYKYNQSCLRHCPNIPLTIQQDGSRFLTQKKKKMGQENMYVCVRCECKVRIFPLKNQQTQEDTKTYKSRVGLVYGKLIYVTR